MNSSDVLKFGALHIDSVTRTIFVGRTEVLLRNKEFSLIDYLARNKGKVLSRTQILEDVWDRNICCATNTVDVHVSSLRHKLKRYYKKDLIHTVHCIGYIFEF